MRRRNLPGSTTVPAPFTTSCRTALLAAACCCAVLAGTSRADDGTDRPWAVSIFGGPGSDLDLSDTLKHLPSFDNSSDRIAAVALSRELARFDGGALSLDGELMGAHHFGNQRYEEIGAGLYARWHVFPWNDRVLTTMAIGIGPSYTTATPELEFQPGEVHHSRVLNQFNPEITFALPSQPQTALLLRLQHRSGMFGLIDGGWGSSNYLAVGLRQHF